MSFSQYFEFCEKINKAHKIWLKKVKPDSISIVYGGNINRFMVSTMHQLLSSKEERDAEHRVHHCSPSEWFCLLRSGKCTSALCVWLQNSVLEDRKKQKVSFLSRQTLSFGLGNKLKKSFSLSCIHYTRALDKMIEDNSQVSVWFFFFWQIIVA